MDNMRFFAVCFVFSDGKITPDPPSLIMFIKSRSQEQRGDSRNTIRKKSILPIEQQFYDEQNCVRYGTKSECVRE